MAFQVEERPSGESIQGMKLHGMFRQQPRYGVNVGLRKDMDGDVASRWDAHQILSNLFLPSKDFDYIPL